ncbi:MAG: metallophosphoesterase family protein [Candidatus Omnitrophica bacterium]|nr:metallophosphoesterase family protein [Candidatus Omnitrophota bacterium]
MKKLCRILSRLLTSPVERIVLSKTTPGEGVVLWLVSDIHSPDKFSMTDLDPGQFDLALTLGDIDTATMDYILYNTRFVETFGVYGNHDPKSIPGVMCIEGKILELAGWTISGLCGSTTAYQHLHKPFAVHVYSEREVRKKLKRIGPVDILISHAPPFSVSQEEGVIHQGFHALDDYIETCRPKYVIYGHLHKRQRHRIGDTEVVGIVEKDYLKIPPASKA